MKRDMNLIREMLLWIEEQPPGHPLRTIGAPDTYDAEVVKGHIRLMDEAGLLDGNVQVTPSYLLIAINGLTNRGHDLLDTIRDETVWEKTKEKVQEVGGSVSIETLKAVATSIVTKILLG